MSKQVSYKGPGCKERSEFDLFIVKMDQFAANNSVYEFMQKEKHPDLPDKETVDMKDMETAERKKVMDTLRKNKVAMGFWTHAFDNMALMNIVRKTKTTEWPSGQAWLV